MNELLQYLPQIAIALAVLVLILLIAVMRLSSAKTAAKVRDAAYQKAAADWKAHEDLLQGDLTELRSAEITLLKRQAELETQLAAEKKRNLETSALLKNTEERFTSTFKALSQDALQATQEQFLDLAQSTFATEQKQAQGELEKREQAVAHLVEPVAESLEKMQGRIGEIEKAREGAYASLKEQVSQLHTSQQGLQKETAQLVKALRQPSGRGQWGEIQLQRVVEMAGMQEHCDFSTQTTTTTDEGKQLRPDLIVHLPGGKQIIVDAKTPMDAYLDALETDSEEHRTAHLKRHAAQVTTHIRQLSSKKYQAQFQPTPEFVVLFLPSESFFSAALSEDSSLLEKGVDQNVILATPTTLIALLRSVAYGWRQEALATNARVIADTGRELHKRLTTFTGHLSKIGSSLDHSVKSYNAALGSLDRMVLPSAKKFETLEAAESQLTLEKPKEIEATPLLAETPTSQPETQFEGFTLKAPPEKTIPSDSARSAADDLRAALE